MIASSNFHYHSVSEERIHHQRNRYDTDQVTDEGEIDYDHDLEELEFEASKFTGKARIQVAVRMRPLLNSDIEIGLKHIGENLVMDEKQVQVQLDRGTKQGFESNRNVFKTFKFDSVFKESDTQ